MAGPVAPDGGFWGWMAVIACFMGNVIGDGVMYRWGCTHLVKPFFNFVCSVLEFFYQSSRNISNVAVERSQPSTLYRWESLLLQVGYFGSVKFTYRT